MMDAISTGAASEEHCKQESDAKAADTNSSPWARGWEEDEEAAAEAKTEDCTRKLASLSCNDAGAADATAAESMQEATETLPSDSYAQAARAICEADVFVLCTGAGFSADSGLAVYKDIAQVPAYHELGLKYHDICDPMWLDSNPSLFYGFWGMCFNDYRHTRPHEGYAIIENWKKRFFSESGVSQAIQQRLREQGDSTSPTSLFSGAEMSACGDEPYQCDGVAGAFFVFTSNVDAHSFDVFDACEVRECHGNTELWQCSQAFDRDRAEGCKKIWRAPSDLHFAVDLTTMQANDSSHVDNLDKSVAATDDVDTSVPKIGHVHRSERIDMLKGWPPICGSCEDGPFKKLNRPLCPECGGPARPAILMFGDGGWLDNEAQEDRWHAWTKAVGEEAKARSQEHMPPLKVCIVEIGAGKNVPTVRSTSERTATKVSNCKAECTIVRINRDFPDRDRYHEENADFISLEGGGLECLKKLDAELSSLLSNY